MRKSVSISTVVVQTYIDMSDTLTGAGGLWTQDCTDINQDACVCGGGGKKERERERRDS